LRNEFTSVIERDGDWYIAYCPEFPGANGQGQTIQECRASLAEAIGLILEECREEGMRKVPPMQSARWSRSHEADCVTRRHHRSIPEKGCFPGQATFAK
jgi:predicted RNase H-like HicB family nuclease